MCNRYLSRKWTPERDATAAEAERVLAGVTVGLGATIKDLRDITYVRQQVRAAKAIDLLRKTEERVERRGRKLATARRAAKIVGYYSDRRGSVEYALWDQARWLLTHLNQAIEAAVLDRDLRLAYADNAASDQAIADLAGHHDWPVETAGLPADDRRFEAASSLTDVDTYTRLLSLAETAGAYTD